MCEGGLYSPLFRHLIIDSQPIRCDLDLCLLQRNGSRTYLIMQVILDLVFLMETWRRTSKFGPEIGNIV